MKREGIMEEDKITENREWKDEEQREGKNQEEEKVGEKMNGKWRKNNKKYKGNTILGNMTEFPGGGILQ